MLEIFTIFFDIDGVVCSCYGAKLALDKDGEQKFNQSSIIALNTIIQYYNADLCMISSWNTKFQDEKHYKDFLVNRGILVNNLVIGDHVSRSSFISNYLKENNLTRYLVIDDEAYKYYEDCIKLGTIEYKRILQPNRYRCLDEYDATQVITNYKL